MKKLISLAVVACILLAMIAPAVPANAFTFADYIDDVEAKYFDTKPFIDGYVSVEEWGAPTIGVFQNDAATAGDRSPKNSSFFYHEDTYDANSLKMSYEMWFRWDENYFYVAVKANDPDGHSLKNSRFDSYNGDAFEMRVDPAGCNGIAGGGTFVASDFPPSYEPWSSNSVCDLVFGYVQRANGYSEAYDNTDGEIGRGMTGFSSNPGGVADVAVVPAGYQYSTDSANGITTYEIAVPWAYIDFGSHETVHGYYNNSTFEKKDANGNLTSGPEGGIGREYGISTVLYNADGNTGADSFNALLAWGSGVASVQQNEENLGTCGGSNQLTLSADKVSEDSAYNANFSKYTEGGYVAPKKIPGYGTAIDLDRYVKLTYDNESDMDIIGWISNGERVKLDDGNWVAKWNKATGLEEPDPDTGVYPALNTSTVISTAGEEGEKPRYPVPDNSFTFEFDIMVTGLDEFDPLSDSGIYNLFGGTSGTDYKCGYFFDDGKFKIIDNNTGAVIAESWKSNFALNEWHHWVFQYDDETCTVRLYIDPFDDDIVWELDSISDEVSGAFSDSIYSAYPMFDFSWRYFDYGSAVDCLLAFGRSNAQIMLDNIEMYNFVDYRYKDMPAPETSGTCGLYGDNLTWELDPSLGVLTISGEGEMDNYKHDSYAPWYWYRDIIRTVVINEGATTIGNFAFDDCSALESISIPDSVTSIGDHGFTWCRAIKSINLPDSVTRIGAYAFFICSSLESINIPDSVTSIGECAFDSCKSLKSISIPSGVTCIEDNTFYECSALEYVNIPKSVTSIGKFAFGFCTSLKSINLPDSVSVIGARAFSLCTALESIVMPKSVTHVVWGAFSGCYNLKTVYYTGTEEEWNNIVIEEYNEPLLSAHIIFNYDHEILLGDANGDGEIDMKDVLLLRRYISGMVDIDVAVADVNGDGEVNMKDILLLRQYIAGIITEFPGK